MDGLILARKPVSWTSFDVVRSVRRTLAERRVGHFGTLDPLASGLLLVAVGRATRLFPYFSAYEKTYRALIRLGIATDTYDAEGTPSGPECADLPAGDAVSEALGRFVGDIEQVPPPFSAKKLRGRPLYAYARKKQDIEAKPSRVNIRAFTLLSFVPPRLEAEVVCSSGTYVRGLAHDLGRALGCGAHLAGLVRTAIGPYRIEDALEPDEIRRLEDEGRRERFLIPLERLLPERPARVLNAREAGDVIQGRTIRPEGPLVPIPEAGFPPRPPIVRLFGPDGKLLALAKPGAEPGTWSPVVVFA